MTTDNQNTTTITEETTATYSKATSLGRNVTARSADKTTTGMKTLSLRPTRSVKKNNSFKPTKKLR